MMRRNIYKEQNIVYYMESDKMIKEEWRKDLKRVFESFQHSYIEDAKDESIAGDYENKTYEEFEDYIFSYITEFFERNESD